MIRVDVSVQCMSKIIVGWSGRNTHIYFILLRKLGCMLSGCHRKINITNAQLKLAKTGHAWCRIAALVSGDNLCVNKVGIGVVLVLLMGSMLSRASANITRAKT